MIVDDVRKILQNAINQQIFPGCIAAVIKGDLKAIIPLGHFTYDVNSTIISESSVFDIASVTKAIPVSCLTLKLLERENVKLNDRMTDYLPEFKGKYREKITIKHLLTQTLHFNFRLSEYKDLPSEKILEHIMNANLQSEPGTLFSYSNTTSIILGLLIERVCNKKLDIAAQEFFFEPLEMRSTTFHPEILSKDTVVPTEQDTWRGRLIQGEVHDESAWALRPLIVGSAGLFSTGGDLLNFVEMLINKGEWKKSKIFHENTIEMMATNQLKIGNHTTGLGWELNQPDFMGKLNLSSRFGKTGFTGCSVVVDIDKRAGLILLSNHIFPKRPENRNSINSIRKACAEIVFS